MGEGSWDLEEGRNPEFLRGVEARRGGGELGAGCLGTKQEAGFLVSPPTGPAHPCQLPPVLFSHPNYLLDLASPGVVETGKSSSSSSGGISRWGDSWPSHLQSFSRPPTPGSVPSIPSSASALSTQELATQEVVLLLRTPPPPGPFSP